MESPILNKLLPRELLNAGFSLAEDEHFVELKLKGSVIGTYNATKVTRDRLILDAYAFWEEIRGVVKPGYFLGGLNAEK